MTHRAKWGSVKAFLAACQPGDVWACATEREAQSVQNSARQMGLRVRYHQSHFTVRPPVLICTLKT